ncbi:MAG: hypothetical protein Q4D98_01315 [Planctomycetia bacterium]|nr:hypothetical protein [Planctomycetia bacterium]
MTEKLAVRALGECWLNPWYNLRKSFCTDLLPIVRDISVYEEVTDHSYSIAKKHYQIMTGTRLQKGLEEAATLFTHIGISSAKTSETTPEMRGLKRGLHGGPKWELALHCGKMRQKARIAGSA